MDEIGPRLTEVLQEIYESPKTVQCDFVRFNAAHVAAAASLGLVTTRLPNGEFSRRWRITENGMKFLRIFQ